VAGCTPFGEEEYGELTRLGRTLFQMGNGTVPSDLKGEMQKWGLWVTAFLASVNPMSGALQHLPFSGGVLEQPSRTMSVWRHLQGLYIECMPKGDGVTERIRGN